MKNDYSLHYDSISKLFRKYFPLDQRNLFHLSEYSDLNKDVLAYSIDVEKTDRTQYEIPAEEMWKLSLYFNCQDDTEVFVAKLRDFFKTNGEYDFVNILDGQDIKYHKKRKS